MPAKRPQATFEPISPTFDVRELVESTENFQYVDRISCEMIEQQGMEQFERLVLLHVVVGGKPLVVDGFEDLLEPWTFTPKWLQDNHGGKVENARNLTTKENIPLTIAHYLKNMSALTDQYFQKPTNYKDKNRQRIYLKDIDCPPVWQDKLKDQIPASLFYLNETTGDVGGLGSVDDPTPGAGGRRKGRGIGRAGDLMSSLPPEMRAENLMCYIGHEGTYTPSHREMCASLGQNIMVDASSAVGPDGQQEKPGSSLWFMTETKDRHTVSEYWLSMLGHDIEVENHFAQLNAWISAPFKTYVVEQRPGDFILIPPLAPHQVWNRGTRTMKIAWNRTTVETLEMAMNEALPNARMVCRDEQYKNKAIVYYTIFKYSNILKSVKAQCEANPELAHAYASSPKIRQIQKDIKRLFELYKGILLSEMFSSDHPKEHPEFEPFDSNITCAYCRGNIFNRFLTCKSCPKALGTEVDEPYDICMECYVMGRSCGCISDLKWVEQWKWKDLLYKYEEWRRMIIDIDGGLTEKTPQPLADERRYYEKKTLAQICQEQLRSRPWVDIQNPKPLEEENEEEDIIVNDDGTIKKVVKRHSKAYLNNNKSCHVCLHKHPKWKMAMCTFCDAWWCYGTLYRAHDLMPQQVMEDLHWKCPHCRKVCSAGRCRLDPRQKPFEPKGTLLGHDTRKVADVRSVEALFNYGVSNLNWITETDDPLSSSRLQALQAAAEHAKLQDPTMDDHFEDENGIRFSPAHEGSGDMIDPALGGTGVGAPRSTATQPIEVNDVDGIHELESPPPKDETGFEDSTIYPDPDPEPTSGSKKKKRRRSENQIQLANKAPKRRKKGTGEEPEETAPVSAASGATKEFRKEQEKKQLSDARENNRYIIVWAAMRGKKKIVTLNIDPEKLQEIQSRYNAKAIRNGRQSNGNGIHGRSQHDSVILTSDITKAQPNGAAAKTAAGAKSKATPNQVRVRVEEDKDFSIGRRRKDDGTSSNRRLKYAARQFEEIEIPSDEEAEQEYAPQTANRRAMREEDLVQLPDDFRDGAVSRRNTLPKSGAQIRPPNPNQHRSNGKFARVSLPSKAQQEAAALRARTAAAAIQAENLNAKMDIAGWAEEGDENEPISISEDEERDTQLANAQLDGVVDTIEDNTPSDNVDEDLYAAPPVQHASGFTPVNLHRTAPAPSPAKPTSLSTAEARTSLFSRPGMEGKKIKIIGTSASTTSTPTTANGKTATPRREIIESESEDEIPAKTVPVPARRGPVPSGGGMGMGRGGTPAKRGRGRPPKIR